MILSMTGFALKNISIAQQQGKLEFNVLIKTLNARYFEVNCRLPSSLQHLEIDIQRVLKSKLMRGTVYVTIQMTNPALLKSQPQLSLPLVESYVRSLETIKQKFDISGAITISDIVALPSVFDFPESFLGETIVTPLMNGLNEAADVVMESRKAEGATLLKDIDARVQFISDQLPILENRAKTVFAQKKEQLQTQMAPLMNMPPSETREQHVQLMQAQMQRYDVTEEIVRFGMHLESLKKVLHNNEIEKGKKIDFILQELGREINTMAAKANDAELSEIVVSIKVELEKIREQAQNIL